MLAVILLEIATLATPAAAMPVGEWYVEDRSARVAIHACGRYICGRISWSSDGKDIGQPILINLRPDGSRWTGLVVDVRDGTKYVAHVAMRANDTLRLDGCVLNGLICNGETWTRYR